MKSFYILSLIIMSLILPAEIVPVSAQQVNLIQKPGFEMAIYVDGEIGSDDNNGTSGKPYKTLQKAADVLAQYNKDMKNHIFVFIKGKTILTAPLRLGTQHSGTNGFNVVFTSWGKEKPIISGEQQVTDFKPYKDGIYRAIVKKGTQSRQFFVNGLRATRARSVGVLTNGTFDKTTGHTTTDTFLAGFNRIQELEFVYNANWAQQRCTVAGIAPGEKEGTIQITMKQPGFFYITNAGGCSATAAPDWYENALELLDQPGEWYLDSTDGYLYYKPRSFENLSTAKCVLPVAERLVDMTGTPDSLIHNIVFDNIEFKYTTWLRPGTIGWHSCAQNNELRENGKGTIPKGTAMRMTDAAVMGTNVQDIDFTNCKFDKLGIIGLGIMQVCKDFNVTGCEFSDISGNGINIGESYLPNGKTSMPLEYRNENINISNNYLRDIGVDFFSSSAIGITYGVDIILSHNEIFNVPYSGIHTGHSDGCIFTSGMRVMDNYIHRFVTKLHDGGAFYHFGPTAGIVNPNRFEGNYTTQSMAHGWSGGLLFYMDNGTTDFIATRNVFSNLDTDNKLMDWFLTNSGKRLNVFDNYMTHDPKNSSLITWSKPLESSWEDPHYFPDGNWPQAAKDIIDNAGIESQYIGNFNNTLQWLELPELDVHTPTTKRSWRDYIHYVYPSPEKGIKVGGEYLIKPSLKTREDNKYMKNGLASLPGVKLYYSSSDKKIATVDALGNVTGIKQGIATISVYAVEGEMFRETRINFLVGDLIGEIEMDPKEIKLFENGQDQNITFKTSSALRGQRDITDVKFSISDESIATCESNYKITGVNKVTGVKPGKTTLTVAMNIDGKIFNKEYPVEVNKIMPLDEGASTDNGLILCNPKGWIPNDGSVIKPKGNGVELSTNKMVAFDKIFGNEMFEFNLNINASSGNSSIALRQKDKNFIGSWGDANDYYLITFNASGTIDLQRFYSGIRTIIYNKMEAPKSDFKYGEPSKVKTAAVHEANGVRILLYVNDKKIIDYLDTDDKAIKRPGYFAVYAGSGSMEISPVKK